MKNPLVRWAWYERTTGGNPNWPDPAPTVQVPSPEADVDEEQESISVSD